MGKLFDVPFIGEYAEQIVATGEVGPYLVGDLLRRQIFSLATDEFHDPEDPPDALELGTGLRPAQREVVRVSIRITQLHL
jgi:hypothetical protein